MSMEYEGSVRVRCQDCQDFRTLDSQRILRIKLEPEEGDDRMALFDEIASEALPKGEEGLANQRRFRW